MKYGIANQDWEKIYHVFSSYPHIQKAILFGSRAKGTNKAFSDVDIALTGSELTITDLLNLKNDIDELLLPYDFDLCIFKDLNNNDLIDHINRRGIELYVK